MLYSFFGSCREAGVNEQSGYMMVAYRSVHRGVAAPIQAFAVEERDVRGGCGFGGVAGYGCAEQEAGEKEVFHR